MYALSAGDGGDAVLDHWSVLLSTALQEERGIWKW